jgi:hypothetical protein
MPELAALLITFANELDVSLPFLADHLRFPRDERSSLKGSEIGKSLWALPQGQALLSLAADDEQVRAAVGHWPVEREVRMILGSAIGRWLQSGVDLTTFAYGIEDLLWTSLRRSVVRGTAVCVAEGITTSEVLNIDAGLQIRPADEEVVHDAFAPVWPEYANHLPSNPHALLVSVTTYDRAVFSGIAGSANPWAFGVPQLRELIWLVTGQLPRLNHGVSFDDDSFPIAEPIHMQPELGNHPAKGSVVDLVDFKPALAALSDRFLVLGRGADGGGPLLDDHTDSVLVNLHVQATTAIDSPDPRIALQYAFAAADGSLLDRDEGAVLVARRFAWLVGEDDVDTEEIRRSVEQLKWIRESLAHGDNLTNGQIASFLGVQGEATEGDAFSVWRPPPWDPSPNAARLKALDLLRRLFRSWLLVAIAREDGELRAGQTRDSVRALLRAAQRGPEPIQRIRTLTQISN